MNPILLILVACIVAALVSSCSSDDTVVPTDDSSDPPLIEVTTTIGADEYENNRFFKLDLPAMEPQGRRGAERIELASIKIFRLLEPGQFNVNDIAFVAAYVDSAGFRDWHDGAMDFTAPHVYGTRWREVIQFDVMLDVDGRLVAIDLRTALPGDDVLAVVYSVVDDQGQLVAQVGDDPSRNPAIQEIPGEQSFYYRMKMLKADPSRNHAHVFDYVLRNIYSLGAQNIDLAAFDLRIEANDAAIVCPDVDEMNIPYFQIFGLDSENPAGIPGADGLVDFHNPLLFNLSRGLLKFPADFPQPFNASEAQYEWNADSEDFSFASSVYLSEHLAPELYDSAVSADSFPQYRYFKLRVTYLRYDLSGETLDEVPFERRLWAWASAPSTAWDANDARTFEPENRADVVRWFLPRERTLSRYLNPDLTGASGNETEPVMDLYLRSDSGLWEPETWGGVMTRIGRFGADLTGHQALEIWVNDGRPEIEMRSGTLHVDFGDINEDGFWPEQEGTLESGTYQKEDANSDGVWVNSEDIGLDGLGVTGPQRFSADYVGVGDPYPFINGTASNNREDDEDLNHNGRFDLANRYFTTAIDLKNTPAIIDVVYDYDSVDDLVAEGIAWRKYRLELADILPVAESGDPDLSRISHLRIWYEDDGRYATDVVHLQFSGLRFLR